jgi:peptide/nickel transport system permease protein
MLDDNGNMIPLYKQYAIWLWNASHFNFGESAKYSVPVSRLILARMPVTLTMNVIEVVIVYLIAIPGGMLSAVKRGRYFDRAWSVITLMLFSIPIIWFGGMMLYFFANPQHLGWFPSSQLHSINSREFGFWSYMTDYLWHLVLPVFVMTLGGFAYLSKMMRASLLDNLNQDYVRTARAKGVGPVSILLRHVTRNSLLPMITIFATVLPGLLGGSIIIEYIFSIPGMGQLGYTATLSRDLPVLQSLAFIGALVGLLSILLQDLCYAFADPRVSYD